ncbi:hypothetical protein [Bacteroides helcogenes]|uniref:Uncharacterized protein n=1 Tax=Bacteroides helcogenes (strain ATCC 35417 / DSM 20613 / JCM 6297 / CCUG 15421 / P 36-108) TaxID=693979 RepID=E6SVG2_BACT6|nr:hypothetical protein [Bacteroides helcogenes]ADV42472.1 hypothetical protein Bache_0446 [Bacteroides helcogenes P 36-108]MDY5237768.1 hypothetical protein [Bacteroides helcogenes]
MKKLITSFCFLSGLFCIPAVPLCAQVNEQLKADIIRTGYVSCWLMLVSEF